MTKFRIERADFGGNGTPLEFRRYHAVKQISEGRWHQTGRYFTSAKSLYNFVRTPGIAAEFADGEMEDVKAYESFVRERNRAITIQH